MKVSISLRSSLVNDHLAELLLDHELIYLVLTLINLHCLSLKAISIKLQSCSITKLCGKLVYSFLKSNDLILLASVVLFKKFKLLYFLTLIGWFYTFLKMLPFNTP